MNTKIGPLTITLKYFAVGHTFMSADSFHRRVEAEMKKMKHVCEWDDFKRCVRKSGQVCEMQVSDFMEYESGLTQSKESKQTRPLLENVSAVEFRKGSTVLHFKTSHTEIDYQTAVFLKKKTRKAIESGEYNVKCNDVARGINKVKRDHIIQNLGGLME